MSIYRLGPKDEVVFFYLPGGGHVFVRDEGNFQYYIVNDSCAQILAAMRLLRKKKPGKGMDKSRMKNIIVSLYGETNQVMSNLDAAVDAIVATLLDKKIIFEEVAEDKVLGPISHHVAPDETDTIKYEPPAVAFQGTITPPPAAATQGPLAGLGGDLIVLPSIGLAGFIKP